MTTDKQKTFNALVESYEMAADQSIYRDVIKNVITKNVYVRGGGVACIYGRCNTRTAEHHPSSLPLMHGVCALEPSQYDSVTLGLIPDKEV